MKLILFSIAFTLLSCQSVSKKKSEPFETEEAPYVKRWQERQLAAEKSEYKIIGTCGGLPKVNVKTAPGFCLGLVDSGENMIFPRTAAELDQNNILVVDMGGWAENRGRIYLLKLINGKYQRSVLLDATKLKNTAKKPALDRPHLIKKGPDGLYYLGAAGTISRFNPSAADVESTLELIITNIPKLGLHPLKSFEFHPRGDLFVNVGSATNVCQKDGFYFQKKPNCKEAEENEIGQALVRQYFRETNGTYSPNYKIYSRGLRNSMGLYWSQTHEALIQIENGRDDISNKSTDLSNIDLPHEELNILYPDKHYGWPYCYDNNLLNPEWRHLSCHNFEKPYLLLPAHSSPLSMLNYQGKMFPAWYKNRIIMTLHGYEARGHRLVTFLRDDRGLPTGKPLSIVYGWDKSGSQGLGNPVGVTELKDGSLVIVEDNTQKVVRLFFDAKLGDGKPVDEIPAIVTQSPEEKNRIRNLKIDLDKALGLSQPPLFARIQEKMIDKHCASCHSGADARGMQLNEFDFINNEKRILKKEKSFDILDRIKGKTHLSQMPPDGFESENEKKEIIDLYVQWLNSQKISRP